jgi:hypothetical protein
MADPTNRPGKDALAPLVSGLLSPSLRRDLADLNAQYLELGLACAPDGDPRFAWGEAVRDCLRGAEDATLARVAASPFALFELALPPAQAAARVEDGRASGRMRVVQSRCESFAHQAAFVAQRVVEQDALAARVVLALSAEARTWLRDCRPSQLAGLATDVHAIRPRWRQHAYFWETLVGAARRDSTAALDWAHCIGLCLIGAEDHAPSPRRRPRR